MMPASHMVAEILYTTARARGARIHVDDNIISQGAIQSKRTEAEFFQWLETTYTQLEQFYMGADWQPDRLRNIDPEMLNNWHILGEANDILHGEE